MTTEQKARAYDEALKKAKEIKEKIMYSHLSTESCKAVSEYIDTIIPELTESEDERIRKDIINLIYWLKGNPGLCSQYYKDRYDGMLIWLEKQKENIEKEYVFRPLAGTDITIAAEQAIRRANEGDHLVLAFNGAYIPVKKGCNANKIVGIYDTFIEKQKEQKPVKRSLEDDHIIGFVYDLLTEIEWKDNWAMSKEECLQLLSNYSPHKPVDSVSKEEYVKRFKALCDAYEIKLPNREYDIYHLCDDLSKLSIDSGKQEPAEWSEEDNIGWDEAFACVTIAKKAAKNEEELQNAVTAEKWLKEIKFKYCVHPVEQEWDEFDKDCLKRAIWYIENPAPSVVKDTNLVLWLQSIAERFNLQPIQEWSEKDEEMYARVVHRYTDYEGVIMRTKNESVAAKMLDAMAQEEIWLKSLKDKDRGN